jgi:hypothetical protein
VDAEEEPKKLLKEVVLLEVLEVLEVSVVAAEVVVPEVLEA